MRVRFCLIPSEAHFSAVLLIFGNPVRLPRASWRVLHHGLRLSQQQLLGTPDFLEQARSPHNDATTEDPRGGKSRKAPPSVDAPWSCCGTGRGVGMRCERDQGQLSYPRGTIDLLHALGELGSILNLSRSQAWQACPLGRYGRRKPVPSELLSALVHSGPRRSRPARPPIWRLSYNSEDRPGR